MERYPLQDMVFVRTHREDKASKALTIARRAVAEAERFLAQKQQELEEYAAWRAVEEERLIQSILKRPVKLGDITDIRFEITGMRDRELDCVDQVRKAEGELDRVKAEMEQAKVAYRKATQELEKLVEHRTAWQEEQNFEIERLADLELEDFIGPKNQDLELQPEDSHYELN